MKTRNYLALLLAALIFAAALTGCSPAPMEKEANGMVSQDAPGKELAEPDAQERPAAPESRKLIRTWTLEAETEDLDALLANIDSRLAELGGYVEDRSVYNGSPQSNRRIRNADMTLRIPVDSMDAFIDQVSEISNIISSAESSQDITLSYVATQSRITALETEEARLLELLAKAETMEDLLKIESRLTDVRGELENITSQLRLYDNLVDFGTIHLRVQEVKLLTVIEEKPTLWQRISHGFRESWENLGLWLTGLLVLVVTRIPYLIPIAVVLLVVLGILRLTNRKKKKRRQPPEQTSNP